MNYPSEMTTSFKDSLWISANIQQMKDRSKKRKMMMREKKGE